MAPIVDNVVFQHAENACALWLQRHSAVAEPHYTFSDLVHLDNRVEANLDGLRIAGKHALPIVDEFIVGEDDGAYFTKSILLLEKGALKEFLDLVESVENNRVLLEEIEAALSWVKPDYLATVVKDLLSGENTCLVELGLKACAAHRKPARTFIGSSLQSQDADLRATAMQVGANTGLAELQNMLLGFTDFETDREKFQCARALSLLGNQGAASVLLHALATGDSAYKSTAVSLMAMFNDASLGRSLLKTLDNTPGRQRDVVRGFGFLGDPVAVDWLINKTTDPDLCRLAGGSITMITGIDLAESDLETLDEPEGFADPGPNDNPEDHNTALDEDEDLPWP
ncbi:MAG: hypothetical protein AAF404_10920, partial [Pseudomonadota bacterium]